MILDILMAFIIALLIEMASFCDKCAKQIVIFICCLTLVLWYFTNGYQIGFIGKIDLAVWIMLVILFDISLMFINKCIKR